MAASKFLMETFRDFFTEVAYPLIDYVRRNCKETIVTMNQNLLQSLFRILNCFL